MGHFLFVLTTVRWLSFQIYRSERASRSRICRIILGDAKAPARPRPFILHVLGHHVAKRNFVLVKRWPSTKALHGDKNGDSCEECACINQLGRFSKHNATWNEDATASTSGARADVLDKKLRPERFCRFSRRVHNATAFSTLCARRSRNLASSLLNLSNVILATNWTVILVVGTFN